ncbi:hypothetical protein FJY63_04285 [Candidatus Sumerlaeota bacterium]|nr:hypothetical protein [Candidatus Sumerlaeota bacterium]
MNKRFDAVGFMRKRRAEIDREDADLTWEKKSKKTQDTLKGDPIWERLKERVVPTGTPLSRKKTAALRK